MLDALNTALPRIAVFTDGLLAGVFLAAAMAEHGVRTTSAAAWIESRHGTEAVYARVMPPFMLGAILLSLAATVVTPDHLSFATATGLLTAALVLTIVVHLPLNQRFLSWTPTEFPETWSDDRRRWRGWNWVRTGIVALAFGATVAGRF